MSKEEDVVHDAVERLEWDERKEEDTPFKRMRQITRRTALTGGAAGIGALILQACGGGSSSSSSGRAARSSSSSVTSTGTASAATGGSAAAGIFGASKSYKFTLVNHVTTNPFFTPTQNGAADACKLLGCTYQWTGSQNSNVGEMVSAFNSAVSAGVDGIGIALVDLHAFNAPTTKALAAKIPVVVLQRRRRRQRPAGLHRPGPVRLRPGDGPAHRAARPLRRRRPVHRHAGLAEHPAADRRRPAGAEVPLRHQDPRGGDRRGAAAGAVDDRLLRHRASQHQGVLRGGRRQHPEHRPGDQEAQPARAGRQGRRLRPHADHPAAARRRLRSTSRSTSSPTCRASCRSCSSTCTR